MASPKVEALLPSICETVGEGPHWDVATQTLLYVDIISGGVCRWDSKTGETSKINLDGNVSFVIPCERGGYVVGHNLTVAHLDWDTKKVTPIVQVQEAEGNRLNDAKVDASGRLWTGTMAQETSPGVVVSASGNLYSVSADHKVQKHLEGISISNGLDWTDDNSTMYYIDSVTRKINAYDFNIKEGTISNERAAVEMKADEANSYGLPDGMCLDTDGNIWVAGFSSSKVWKFDSKTGKPLQHIDLPTTNITSVCFGGKNLDELFVTCSAYKVSESKGPQPLKGSIFRVTGLGVKGRAPYNFKG